MKRRQNQGQKEERENTNRTLRNCEDTKVNWIFLHHSAMLSSDEKTSVKEKHTDQ